MFGTVWSKIESQRNGASPGLLDITFEFEAMLPVKSTLVAYSRTLIKQVGKTYFR